MFQSKFFEVMVVLASGYVAVQELVMRCPKVDEMVVGCRGVFFHNGGFCAAAVS